MRREEEQQKVELDPHYENNTRYLFQNGELNQIEAVTGNDVPSGFYRFSVPRDGVAMHRFYLPEQDRYIDRSTDASAIREDMLRFFRNKQLYRTMNMAYRRGALVYGPPGTGKTYSIIRTAQQCVEEFDALVFIVNDADRLLEAIAPLGYAFRNRPTIFIFEEIAGANGKGRIKSRFLSFLDGELSWDHNYNVATTNYAGKLPSNIVDRPGRFDMLIRMDEPTRKEQKRFLNEYLGEEAYDEEDLDRMEGYSIAYVKELAIRCQLYDRSIDEILDQFDQQKNRIQEAFQCTENVGFMSGRNGNQ